MPYHDDDETVMLKATRLIHQTDKAVLVYLEDIGEEQWVPLSQVYNLSEFEEGMTRDGSAELEVSRWWAEQKELI